MPSPLHLPPVYPAKSSPADFPLLWAKVSSYVSREDWQLINATLAGQGSVAHIIDHAIHSTAEHIRLRKLTPVVDTARFLDYLRSRSFTCPIAEITGQPGDVARRNAGAREQATDSPNVSTGTREDVKGGRGKRGGKARTKERKGK